MISWTSGQILETPKHVYKKDACSAQPLANVLFRRRPHSNIKRTPVAISRSEPLNFLYVCVSCSCVWVRSYFSRAVLFMLIGGLIDSLWFRLHDSLWFRLIDRRQFDWQLDRQIDRQILLIDRLIGRLIDSLWFRSIDSCEEY